MCIFTYMLYMYFIYKYCVCVYIHIITFIYIKDTLSL